MLPRSLEITWPQNVSNDVVSFFKNDATIKHISNDVASLFRNHAAAKHIVSLFTNNAAAKHQMMLPPSLKRYIPILLCSL